MTAWPVLRIRVPATTANLGPGFDSLALAWDLVDEVVIGPGSAVGRQNLIVRTLLDGLADLGAPAPRSMELRATDAIPRGRGLGSSAAAVACGLLAAWRWARPAEPVDERWVLERGRVIEGHLDNVAAVLRGGLVLVPPGDAVPRVISLPVDERLQGALYLADAGLPTRAARGVLPATVPHADAAANAAAAGLLVHALAGAPEELPAATADRIHQRQRGALMPESVRLLDRLRADGFAAVVSGAGSSLAVIGTEEQLAALPAAAGFTVRRVRPGPGAYLDAAPARGLAIDDADGVIVGSDSG